MSPHKPQESRRNFLNKLRYGDQQVSERTGFETIHGKLQKDLLFLRIGHEKYVWIDLILFLRMDTWMDVYQMPHSRNCKKSQFRSPTLYTLLDHLNNSFTQHPCSWISFSIPMRVSFIKKQDKRLKLLLNGKRKLVGTLRGYDAFLNVVLEDAESDGGVYLGQVVIRGNSIVQFEALERVA
jgi:small nuclear ribonucleoprotein G